MLRSTVSKLTPLEIAEAISEEGSELYSEPLRVDAMLKAALSVLSKWVKRPVAEVDTYALGQVHGRVKHLLALHSLVSNHEDKEAYFLELEHHLDELVLHHLHYRRFLYILKQDRKHDGPRMLQRLREGHAQAAILLLQGVTKVQHYLLGEPYLLKLRQESYSDTFLVPEALQRGMDSYTLGALPTLRGNTSSQEAHRKLTHLTGEVYFFKNATRRGLPLVQESTFLNQLFFVLAHPLPRFFALEDHLKTLEYADESFTDETVRLLQEVNRLVEEYLPLPALARALREQLEDVTRGNDRRSYSWPSPEEILLNVHKQKSSPADFYSLVLNSILKADDFSGSEADKAPKRVAARELLDRLEVQCLLESSERGAHHE